MSWTLPVFALAHPVRWNALLSFGSILLFGLAGGYLFGKSRWIPRISGYLLVGLVLGAEGLNWVAGDVLRLANIFADVGIALLVYQLGRYVDIGWLRREKWLMASVGVGAVICFLLVWAVLERLGTSRPLAMLAGLLAIGTSPAIVMVVVRDLKAEGLVTRRLAAATSIGNFLALLAAYALFPALATEGQAPIGVLAMHAFYTLCGSVLLAYVTYRMMMPLARWLGRERSRQFVLVIAIITLTIGAAHALQLPVLLTMLAFAVMSKNLDQQFDLMELEFGFASELLVVVLFVTVGASIRLSGLASVWLPVIGLLCARFAAVSSGIFVFARAAKLKWRQAALLSLGALPMAEVGLGLLQISYFYPHTMTGIAPLLAGALIFSEMAGPIVTQFALIKSGESGHET